MSLCLYTYSDCLTPSFEDDDDVYPLSLIKVFEPVPNSKEIVELLQEGDKCVFQIVSTLSNFGSVFILLLLFISD